MTTTLYEKVGGSDLIQELIPAFYDRVLSDPELAPFFVDSDVDRIIRMQKEFFSIALGGPAGHSEHDLRSIHAERAIERNHLTRFTDHLLSILKTIGISEEDAGAVVARIATYSNEILGESGGIDG